MPALNCTEFERLLHESIEARSPADERLDAHAAICESCRLEWERYVLLEQVTAAWMQQTPECDLAEDVLAALAEDEPWPLNGPASTPPGAVVTSVPHVTRATARPAGPNRPARSVAAVLAVAGVVLLLASQALFRLVPPVQNPLAESPADERRTVAEDAADIAAPPAVVERPSIPPADELPVEWVALAHEAGSAWRAMTDRTVAAMREGASFVPPVELLLVSRLPDEAPPQDPAVEHEPPFRRQLTETFELLRDVWPWDDEPTL